MSDEANPFASPQTAAVESPEIAWANEQPEALRRVKLGLTLVYVGMSGMTLCFLGRLCWVIFSAGPSGDGGLKLIGLACLAFLFVTLAGQAYCLAVPTESGARPHVIAAIALELGCLFLVLLRIVAPMGLFADGSLFVVQQIVVAASVICFLFFLRNVAKYIQRRDVTGRATRALVVAVLTTIGLIVGNVGMILSPQHLETFNNVLGTAMLAALVSFVMYANTVTYLRKAITV